MDISIAEAHNRLSQLLNQARKGPVTITRRGKPVGVLITADEYERLRQVQAYLQMISLAHTLRESSLSATELYQASRDELEVQA
jgi:prevent-host-death family protein